MTLPDLIAVGDLNFDWLIEVLRFPTADDEVEIIHSQHLPGGDAANICAAAAGLGLKSRLIACAGDDPEGKLLLKELQKKRIDTSLVQIAPDETTGFVISTVRPDGERNLLSFRGANLSLRMENFTGGQLPLSRVFHFSDPQPNLIQITDLMKPNPGQTISLDPGSITAQRGLPELADFLSFIDVFFCNTQEICTLTGISDVENASRRILAAGPDLVVIKRGAVGCLVYTRDTEISQPGFQVEVVDTTGAGDAFNAGWIYALLHKKSLAEAARFACAVGALATTAVGAQSSLPTLAQVEELLHSGQN